MTEFSKNGNRIYVKPAGTDYSLDKEKTYELRWDSWESVSYFEETLGLALPEKTYLSKKDEAYIERITDTFKKTKKLTTGVLLDGIKGTGKSVMAKLIAHTTNVPVIIVNSNYPTSRIAGVFESIKTEVCVIFDEIEKNDRSWRTDDLLGFLDGIKTTCKKLVLFTCNEIKNIHDCFMDRCSRIRYRKTFENKLDEEVLNTILNDFDINDNNVKEVILEKFKTQTIDNILTFIEEYKQFDKLSIDEILEGMNIELKR